MSLNEAFGFRQILLIGSKLHFLPQDCQSIFQGPTSAFARHNWSHLEFWLVDPQNHRIFNGKFAWFLGQSFTRWASHSRKHIMHIIILSLSLSLSISLLLSQSHLFSFSFSFLIFVSLFDDSDSDSLLQISDGESAKWWEFRDKVDNHWLRWGKFDGGSITGLYEFWEFFSHIPCVPVYLGLDLGKFTGNMGSVAIEDWSVSIPYLTGMVHDDYKAPEPLDILGNVRVVLPVGNNVSSLNVS